MINPVFLRTFCTLVEVGHFTKAAEVLCITQSGVSQHIKKLEEQLGVELIDRTSKGFILTASGQRAYDQAKTVVSLLSEFSNSVKLDEKYVGEVRFMSPGTIGLHMYPELLTVQKRHPELAINYRFGPNQSIAQAVENNLVDIGLMTDKPNFSGYSKVIKSERLLLVTPSSIQSPTFEDLMQLGFINHPDGHHHANLLLSKNFAHFTHIDQMKETGYTNQIALTLDPIAMGLGFTVLPECAIPHYVNHEEVTTSTLAHPVSETIYVLSNSKRRLPKRIQFMLDVVEQAFLE